MKNKNSRKYLKKISKILLSFIFIISIILGISRVSVNAMEFDYNEEYTVRWNNIKAVIYYGFDYYARSGRYNNFSVEITNDGEDFEGNLQFMTNSYSEDKVLYQKKINISNNSKDMITISIPIDSYDDKMIFRITDADNNTVVEKELYININYSPNIIFTGVFSEDMIGMSYMDSENSKLFYLNNNILPDDYEGLDVLDVVIINKYKLTDLSDKQLDTIKSWVDEGGSLIMGTDSVEVEYIYSILESWFGVSRSGMTESLIQLTDKPSKEIPINKNVIYDEKNTSKNLEYKNTNVIKNTINYGRGNIQIFEGNICLLPDNMETFGLRIKNNIIESISESRKEKINIVYHGYYDMGVFAGLGNGNNSVPSVIFYGLLLGAYIIIIGPLLYLLLKKKDKRNYIWFCIPVCSLLFTVVIYCMGDRTRVKEPYSGYFSTIFLSDEYNREEAVFSIVSPYKKKSYLDFDEKYKLYVNENDYTEYKEINNISYNTLIEYEEGNIDIELLNNSSFKPVYFTSEVKLNEVGNIDSNIKMEKYKFSGNITNNLGYDIKDVSILYGGVISYIGNINSGETAVIDNPEIQRMNSSESIYTGEILKKITGYRDDRSNAESRRKYSALSYYLGNNLIYNYDYAYIMGFTDNISGESVVNEIGYDAYGTNMVIQQFEPDYSSKGITFVPSIDKYAEGLDIKYRYIEGDDAIYQYDFDENDIVRSIEYLEVLNEEFLQEESSDFKGKVYFYNNLTEEYDFVFDSEQKGSKTDLGPYLNEKNQLIIKYDAENTESVNVCFLPYLSATKEEK